MSSDEELMVAASRGDLDAFEELVRRHQEGAVNVAWRMLGDRGRAQDAAQDAFLRVWEHAASYRPSAAFRTYLYRILTRLCIDQDPRRRPSPSDRMDEMAGSEESPDEALARRERVERVSAAIERLPERQRIALVLRHYEGMSYEHVAEVLNCSVRAVDSLLLRAKRSLASWLADLA